MTNRKIAVVTILLAACQILDGTLTYIGVTTHGVHAEGNPLIKFLMQHLDVGPALVLAKSIALVFIGILFFGSLEAQSKAWLYRAFSFLVIFYGLVAILPWLVILYT